MAPSKFTSVKLLENIQTTGGWLEGIRQAKKKPGWFAYWFLITSAEFIEDRDPLTPLAILLGEDPEAVGIHPALSEDSSSDWPHLFDRGSGAPRRTWHIDNIASLYRADWFDQVGGFDPRMSYAWGIDLDLSWKARRLQRHLWIHEGVRIRKTTDIGYQLGRMRMSAAARRRKASAEMQRVLRSEYGPNAWERMTGEFVTEEMLMPGELRELERGSCL